MHRSFGVRTIAALAIAISSANAETIRIRVLDGRNGKAIRNERLNVWIGAAAGRALALTPGADWSAELEVQEGSSIAIGSNLYVDCRPSRKGDPSPTYAVDEIMRRGVVTPNTCGKVHSDSKSGELLLFVRPPPLLEEMRR